MTETRLMQWTQDYMYKVGWGPVTCHISFLV